MAKPGAEARTGSAYARPPMESRPVTVTFPAVPEYLRLARIATADAASRAGLDYEEIDDVRIAVSELCSLVSVERTGAVTLAFPSRPAPSRSRVSRRPALDEVVGNDLSRAIVAAVADDHSLVTDDGVTRFRWSSALGTTPPDPTQSPDATTQAQRGLEPASSGPGGAGTSKVPPGPTGANVPPALSRAGGLTTTVNRCCSGGGSCCSSSPSSPRCWLLGVLMVRDAAWTATTRSSGNDGCRSRSSVSPSCRRRTPTRRRVSAATSSAGASHVPRAVRRKGGGCRRPGPRSSGPRSTA